MPNPSLFEAAQDYLKDLLSGLIVFLVALPLCLGIALASGAPLFSGILSGIIGGVVVGLLNGSKTSVSGPAGRLGFEIAFRSFLKHNHAKSARACDDRFYDLQS